jgi:hypothetical protein
MSKVMFTNAVYFPNHRIYQGDTPGMLNYSCINHVYYAYASVTADGGVFVSGPCLGDFSGFFKLFAAFFLGAGSTYAYTYVCLWFGTLVKR